MKSISKGTAQLRHFQRRFNDRTNTICTLDILESICNDISKGNLAYIGNQSNRIKLYEFDYNEIKYILVYDSIRKNPVTLLFWDLEFLKDNDIFYKNGKYHQLL